MNSMPAADVYPDFSSKHLRYCLQYCCFAQQKTGEFRKTQVAKLSNLAVLDPAYFCLTVFASYRGNCGDLRVIWNLLSEEHLESIKSVGPNRLNIGRSGAATSNIAGSPFTSCVWTAAIG